MALHKLPVILGCSGPVGGARLLACIVSYPPRIVASCCRGSMPTMALGVVVLDALVSILLTFDVLRKLTLLKHVVLTVPVRN